MPSASSRPARAAGPTDASGRSNEFPERLWQALADGGYLGTLVPQEHGGTGLGLTEMAVLHAR